MGCPAVGGFAGPPLAGWVFDESGSYRTAWLLLGALMMIGVVGVLSAPPLRLLNTASESEKEDQEEVSFAK